MATNQRFSDIPSAIDIPVRGDEGDEAVEVNLEDLLDDPTELCTLLENEGAPRTFWMIIALAYAKQRKIDHAVEMLNKGLSAMAHSVGKEKLSMLTCLCWMYLWKSREAPRLAPEGELLSEAKTKDFYLRSSTATLNEATRINPSFPPLFLARGVLCLLRASLKAPSKPLAPGTQDLSERAEDLRQAVKCFDDALRVSGGRNMLAVLGKARVQYSLGKYTLALEAYQEVLRKMPELIDPDPRIGIGCCLWQLGFKDEGKAAWERAIELNPNSSIANVLVGLYYLGSVNHLSTSDPQFIEGYKKAMTEYTQKAFRIDKNLPLTCATFGGFFLTRKAMPQVETLARRAVENADVNAVISDGWYLLARKEHASGDIVKAGDYYRRADDARGGDDKGHIAAKVGMAQVQLATGDYDGAKFRLEKLNQKTKLPEAMIILATIYAHDLKATMSREDRANLTKKAIALLEWVRAAWKDPKRNLSPDVGALEILSSLYEADAPEKSLKCLEQIEELELERLRQKLKPEGDDEAERNASLRANLSPHLLNNLGTYNLLFEQFDAARDLFQTALSACIRIAEPANQDALATTISYNLARTYEMAGLLDDAKKVYAGLLERHQDYTDAHTRLTYIALLQSPNDEGPKAVSKLVQNHGSDLEVRALYGWYLSKSKKRLQNIAEDPEQRHYKHTLQIYDKHDRYALTGMGNLYLITAREMRRESDSDRDKRRKTYEKAVEFYDKALQLDSKNAYAAQGIAIALIEDKKDYNTALQILTKVRDAIRDASVHLNLGHIYAELKQYTRSIENYEVALAKDQRDDPQMLACMGRVWLLKGKTDQDVMAMKQALTYSQQALELAPEQVHFKFNVAFVQIQIAQLLYTLKEPQRILEDVQVAATGLDEAISAFEEIAISKNPPYPRNQLEQRANMGRNTMRRQLERAVQAQRDYEDKNAARLQQAREEREAEKKKREEDRKKIEALEMERKRRIAEERHKMQERDRELAEKRNEEQRRREEADMTTDSETGERVRRKKRAGRRREKSSGPESGSEPDGTGATKKSRRSKSKRAGTSDAASSDDDGGAPKKRRKLERKSMSKAEGKFKSSEIVVESDSDGDDGLGGGVDLRDDADRAEASPDPESPMDVDEDEEDAAPQRTSRKKISRAIGSDSEDEDGGDEPAPATNGTKKNGTVASDEASPAAAMSVDSDDE